MLDFAHNIIFPTRKFSAGKKDQKIRLARPPLYHFEPKTGVKNTPRIFNRKFVPKGQPDKTRHESLECATPGTIKFLLVDLKVCDKVMESDLPKIGRWQSYGYVCFFHIG